MICFRVVLGITAYFWAESILVDEERIASTASAPRLPELANVPSVQFVIRGIHRILEHFSK